MELLTALFARRAVGLAALARCEARAARRRAAVPPPEPPPPPPAADPESVRALEEALSTERRARRSAEERLDHLEERLKKLGDRWAAGERAREEAVRESARVEAASTADTDAAITAALEARGYRRVRLIRGEGDDVRVSAERRGIRLEGRARLDERGELDASLVPTTRAFP
ncbi:MAG: hypothetical protein ACYTG6_07325 [Planctomycetota bacterium]|jgi:hypothetical protein